MERNALFGALYAAPGAAPGVLTAVAREFSPRIEVWGGADGRQAGEIVLDVSGLTHVFGDARAIAEQVRRSAADRGVHVRLAIAGTRTAARLLVRHRAGLTIVEPGGEAAALSTLPLALLGTLSITTNDPNDPNVPNVPNVPNALTSFRRWGLRTLGDLAALPGDDVAARLGREGTLWQRLARGDDPLPLVPSAPEERFEQTLDLEWPIDALEPLSFVLGRVMEPLAAQLERRDRAAAVLHVRLDLVRQAGAPREVYARSLQLPAPIRDARTLRTLALLDLESHPPPAAIDRVTVGVDPTPGRIVQFSLLTRALPSPERLSTLMARLQALMGEARCGSPGPVDSWQPGAFEMRPFAPPDPRSPGSDPRAPIPVAPLVALRRFRPPIPVRVRVAHGAPASVAIVRRGLSGGVVESCAGPWRTSGGWWGSDQGRGIGDRGGGVAWDRDEWDVTLAAGVTYRLFHARHDGNWFIEGVVD